MVKEIKYTGFTASPSDYECPDGDLAAVLNVVPEEGSLSPILPPAELFQLTDGDVRFVHETSYIKNYIILHPDNSITWRTQDDPDEYSHGTLSHSFSGQTIHQINAIGNTLIVLADDGMHYFLWKGYRNGSEQQGDDPKEYLYLGTHMPEISLSFGLQGELINQNYRYGARITTDDYNEATGENRTDVGEIKSVVMDIFEKVMTNNIKAKVNKFIKENSLDKGKFLFPFFVRYAYRLYDGDSLTMHSAPILMMCSYPQGIVYNALIAYDDDNPGYIIRSQIFGMFHKLDYSVVSDISVLKNWKDIIRSVDIFVSSPIYTYDQNGDSFMKYKKLNDLENKYYSVCKYLGAYDQNGNSLSYSYNSKYQNHNIIELIKNSGIYVWDDFFEIPIREKSIVNIEISDCSLFYKVHSINIEDLKTERTVIDIDTSQLKNLGTGEHMVDDYQTRDMLIPKYSYGYNSRFNITNLRLQLSNGYNPASCFQFTNGFSTNDFSSEIVKLYIYIRQDNKEIVVSGEHAYFGHKNQYMYIYYPNKNAYKAVLEIYYENTIKCYEVQLLKHEKLNGAYYFKGWDETIEDSKHYVSGHKEVSTEAERIVNLPGKIYTSEVNNPYFFPVLGVNTVGTGTIYAMCSAAKALSQGQFGQFPLYAFSDEGVWALEVEMRQDANGIYNVGLYKVTQPITRDVCINADSITQLDSSVLFATERGIMLLSGSTSTCISDSLNYDQVFNIDDLPKSDTIINLAGLTQESFSYVAFREFLLGCRMIYDYVHQRIIVYSRYLDANGHPVSPYPYAYVYSLKSKTWGMIPSNIKDSVPSYPEAIAQLFDGSIVDYSSDGTLSTDADSNLTGIKGFFVTRPLKLDAPDVLKTVSTVIQRGNFRRGNVKSVLWGSRDLFHWQLVWSSTTHIMTGFRGTPYKYFRIGVLLDLQPDESLYGCTIEYTPRFTNRLR